MFVGITGIAAVLCDGMAHVIGVVAVSNDGAGVDDTAAPNGEGDEPAGLGGGGAVKPTVPDGEGAAVLLAFSSAVLLLEGTPVSSLLLPLSLLDG